MDPLQFYSALGVEPGASPGEIKRAFRALRVKAHPDKGGNAEAFDALAVAYATLGDPEKRAHYDATGNVLLSASAAFVEGFAGGAFAAHRVRRAAGQQPRSVPSGLQDTLAVRRAEVSAGTHSAGFEAWLRSRGTEGTAVFTADTAADVYGVVRGSYEGVPLPLRSVLAAVCNGPGRPADVVTLEARPLPRELEWGQVLVEWVLAAVTPADAYALRTGGRYDASDATRQPPFVCGHDGVGVVAKVGPGVKDLDQGDVVLPARPLLGCWAEAAVVKGRELVRVGSSMATSSPPGAARGADAQLLPEGAALARDELPLPLEYLAAHRELLLACTLLEGDTLKPGDAVVLNAPNSTVGRAVLQLCRLLRLRAVAVLRGAATGTAVGSSTGDARYEATAARLRELGATLVLRDEGCLKTALSKERFFAKPRLALDAVGGASATRLADVLEQGGRLVVYGCLSGKPPVWPWQAWVFRGLQVRGCNLRKELAADTPAGAARMRKQLATLGALVAEHTLELDFAEYNLDELYDALEHAQEAPGSARVLLRCGEHASRDGRGSDEASA